ncbi:pentapeptide repeat-containing protein [Methylocystis sp.]|uniref:pentapeptide repeat-containing protein n=1 Tax=Methylocystis sp. TaxID=1911079 RepID=UPI0027360572|nr:pentapeptide repeat-containing protein [Methylocystis sp.]MDP3555395.1 pentapeptide repeat-containing protein [Methylocystis sp.]
MDIPHPRSPVDFKNVCFSDAVDLGGFIFPRIVNFDGAEFGKNVRFNRALFADDANFLNSTFASGADFQGTKFSRAGNFRGATFYGSADFETAMFCGGAYFDGATFLNDIFFQGAVFESETYFFEAKFQKSVPDFRDAKLREATEWHDATWPDPPHDADGAYWQLYTYERLKAEMERLKKHEDEQFFFAKELRARRALLWFTALNKAPRTAGAYRKPWAFSKRINAGFRWLLNRSYYFFSGYGLSIGRPLVALGALLCVGAVIFATTNSLHDGPLRPGEALELSATNLISFLPYKPDNWLTAHLSKNAKWVRNAQSFFGLVLLFLLGLALRNRFRMK